MSHCVTAIIAREAVVRRILERHPALLAVPLREDLQLIPLDDDDLDLLGPEYSTTVEGFNYLSPGLESFLAWQSTGGRLVYLETEYFGGAGSQSAVAYENGKPVPPTPLSHDENAINRALACMGVRSREPGVDAFTHVGLPVCRHTSEWKAAAKSGISPVASMNAAAPVSKNHRTEKRDGAGSPSAIRWSGVWLGMAACVAMTACAVWMDIRPGYRWLLLSGACFLGLLGACVATSRFQRIPGILLTLATGIAAWMAHEHRW